MVLSLELENFPRPVRNLRRLPVYKGIRLHAYETTALPTNRCRPGKLPADAPSGT